MSEMRINTNTSALIGWGNLVGTDSKLSKSLERLSSGKRINRAADDAAGLSIAENMRSQFTGLNRAARNAQDGISLIQTAESGLTEVHSLLQRMRELAVQSASGHLEPIDRSGIQDEVDSLAAEMTRMTNTLEFNSKELLNGSLESGGIADLLLQVGAEAGQNMKMGISAMDAKSLGVARDVYTGVVDNGSPFTLDTTALNIDITSAGKAITSGAYQIEFLAPNIWLEDGGGSPIGPAVAYTANSSLTIGDPNTGQTLAISTGAVPGGNATANLTTRLPNAANKVMSAGTGLPTGSYQVAYMAPTTMQLKDSLGVNIGDPVTVTAGTLATLGDQENAKTLKVQVKSPLPSGATTDYITLDGVVGTVQDVQGDESNNVVTDTNGISSVGTKLGSGVYGIDLGAGAPALRLVDPSGSYIGSDMVVNGDGTITVGHVASDRTITINPGGLVPPGYVSVAVTNKGGLSRSAAFSNNMKTDDAQALGGVDVSTVPAASRAIGIIDTAISMVSNQRTLLGAVQNRLESAEKNLMLTSENLLASESRIRDLDVAYEAANMARYQILTQASTAMLSQANARPQQILELIRQGTGGG